MTASERWKLLLSTPDEGEASMVSALLREEGMSCRVSSRHDFPGEEARGGEGELYLYVPLMDFEACQELVSAALAGEEEAEAE